jgi:hypothetical protein
VKSFSHPGKRQRADRGIGHERDQKAARWAGRGRTPLGAASLVVVSERVSDDDLYRELRRRGDSLRATGVRRVLRVGDCVAPRPLGFVLAEGHRLGREIESADPAIPLPPVVERDADAATATFEAAVTVRRVEGSRRG